MMKLNMTISTHLPKLANQVNSRTRKVKKISRDRLFKSVTSTAINIFFDRNKTSYREAVRLLIPIAAALGHDPNALSISRNTIQQAWSSARHEISEAMKDNFEITCPLVIYWDGKIPPIIFVEGSVDRLPVSVSVERMDKLLGVSKEIGRAW